MKKYGEKRIDQKRIGQIIKNNILFIFVVTVYIVFSSYYNCRESYYDSDLNDSFVVLFVFIFDSGQVVADSWRVVVDSG